MEKTAQYKCINCLITCIHTHVNYIIYTGTRFSSTQMPSSYSLVFTILIKQSIDGDQFKPLSLCLHHIHSYTALMKKQYSSCIICLVTCNNIYVNYVNWCCASWALVKPYHQRWQGFRNQANSSGEALSPSEPGLHQISCRAIMIPSYYGLNSMGSRTRQYHRIYWAKSTLSINDEKDKYISVNEFPPLGPTYTVIYIYTLYLYYSAFFT